LNRLPGHLAPDRAADNLVPTINNPLVVLVMGVSGSGKSVVGSLLAAAFGCEMQEGDALHSRENVEKMSHGTPLTDADRLPWLQKIAQQIDDWQRQGKCGVITCSALKRSYRDIVIGERRNVKLVYLKGSRELVLERIVARHGHFMPVSLLESQFAILEEPTADEHAITVDIGDGPEKIVAEISAQLADGKSANPNLGQIAGKRRV
jgi:gluconokinase